MKLVPGDGLEPSRPELDAGMLLTKARKLAVNLKLKF